MQKNYKRVPIRTIRKVEKGKEIEQICIKIVFLPNVTLFKFFPSKDFK